MTLCLFNRYRVRRVNNNKPTVSPNLITNHFRDYRMATNFNFIKTKFNQRHLRNQRAK